MKNAGRKRVYSLGYEGSKPHIIRGILHENKITQVIDIRRKNEAKNSPFNKCRLRDLCRDAEVRYIHEPDLAPSAALLREESQRKKTIREKFLGKDKVIHLARRTALLDYVEQEFKTRYLEELDQQRGCELFQHVVNQEERPCFFSREKFDKLVVGHRKILLDHCLAECGLNVRLIHLREWFHHTGQFHDLRRAFERVNKVQFDNQLKRSEVAFSWHHGLRGGARFIFGQFRTPNLILINQKLDLLAVPDFIINAILHHELIHYTRYRDGRDHRHTVAFYMDELDFEKAGDVFFWDKDFSEKHLPEIKEELELAKMKMNETDPFLKPLYDYIDHIMTGKAKENGKN